MTVDLTVNEYFNISQLIKQNYYISRPLLVQLSFTKVELQAETILLQKQK